MHQIGDIYVAKVQNIVQNIEMCIRDRYESARYRNYDETYDYSNLDVYSRMYPALSEIQEYLDKDDASAAGGKCDTVWTWKG